MQAVIVEELTILDWKVLWLESILSKWYGKLLQWSSGQWCFYNSKKCCCLALQECLILFKKKKDKGVYKIFSLSVYSCKRDTAKAKFDNLLID